MGVAQPMVGRVACGVSEVQLQQVDAIIERYRGKPVSCPGRGAGRLGALPPGPAAHRLGLNLPPSKSLRCGHLLFSFHQMVPRGRAHHPRPSWDRCYVRGGRRISPDCNTSLNDAGTTTLVLPVFPGDHPLFSGPVASRR